MAPRVLIFEKIVILNFQTFDRIKSKLLIIFWMGKIVFCHSGKSLVFQALPYCFFVDKQPEELVKKSTSEEILTSCDKVVL